MKDDNILTQYTDAENNLITAWLYGENLELEYIGNDGNKAIEVFGATKTDLQNGLYRMVKIIGWMKFGVYTNEDRMNYLLFGTMR